MKTTRIELKDCGVLFDKERHEYWLGNRQLSGITGMLQRQLFPDEFDNVPEGMLQEAARYGTEVHESIEAFDSSWINDRKFWIISACAKKTDWYMKDQSTLLQMGRIGQAT